MFRIPSRSRIAPSTTSPAPSGSLHDVVEEVVADDGPVLVHAEEVDNEHIAGLEHVDRDLVAHAADAKGLCVGVDHGVQVGTHGHELHRERATHELLVWMQNLEAVGELVAVALAGQHREHFFGGQASRPLDEPVRHLRPAIGEPLVRVLRRPPDHLVLAEGEELGLDAGGQTENRRRERDDHASGARHGG